RKAHLTPKIVDQAPVAGFLVKRPHLFGVHRWRFLAEHMFAGLERSLRERIVQGVWQANDHRVQLRIEEHFIKTRKYPCRTERLSKRLQAFRIQVTGGVD